MKRPVAVEQSLLPAIGEDASDWSTALPLLDEPEWEAVSMVDDFLRQVPIDFRILLRRQHALYRIMEGDSLYEPTNVRPLVNLVHQIQKVLVIIAVEGGDILDDCLIHIGR